MSYTYAQLKKQGSKKNGAEPFSGSGKESSLPNSAQVAELGHQVDMPVVMREKMEGAFGMDLSSVKLYENWAVGDAGAEAVTQGSRIAFAPGKLDFSSTRGQALLGHEISHVASQARGEVKGSGLVNDSALEARADREGMMAAHGESVSGGFGGASAPLSNASAASASGPMQAKSGRKKQQEQELHDKARAEMESANSYYSTREADEDAELDRAIALENNPVRPEPKKEEAGNSLVAQLKSMIQNQRAKINLDQKTQKRKKARKNGIKERVKGPKTRNNWQNNISAIQEVDGEYAEDLDEPLIPNAIVPQIDENEMVTIDDMNEVIHGPAGKKSDFLEFMHNNYKKHPFQDQALYIMNSITKNKINVPKKFRSIPPKKALKKRWGK